MKKKGGKIRPSPERKRGPKPDIVKIEEDWKEAVKRSLKKKKPKDGWPKD